MIAPRTPGYLVSTRVTICSKRAEHDDLEGIICLRNKMSIRSLQEWRQDQSRHPASCLFSPRVYLRRLSCDKWRRALISIQSSLSSYMQLPWSHSGFSDSRYLLRIDHHTRKLSSRSYNNDACVLNRHPFIRWHTKSIHCQWKTSLLEFYTQSKIHAIGVHDNALSNITQINLKICVAENKLWTTDQM